MYTYIKWPFVKSPEVTIQLKEKPLYSQKAVSAITTYAEEHTEDLTRKVARRVNDPEIAEDAVQ